MMASVKLSKNLNLLGHMFCFHDLQLLKVFSYLFCAQVHSWICFPPPKLQIVDYCVFLLPCLYCFIIFMTR